MSYGILKMGSVVYFLFTVTMKITFDVSFSPYELWLGIKVKVENECPNNRVKDKFQLDGINNIF